MKKARSEKDVKPIVKTNAFGHSRRGLEKKGFAEKRLGKTGSKVT
jgi:hypothetical protein